MTKKQSALEHRYRALKDERGAERPRGWSAAQLADEFLATVVALEPVLVGTGPFYTEGGRELLPDPATVRESGTLASTDEFAALLSARPRFKVDRRPDLDFHYVDRELVAARALDATGKAVYQASPVQLDFLLVTADDAVPIAAEAKLTGDPKDPEAALLQALMYASLLAPAAQRARLPAVYPDLFRLGVPAKVDVYVLLYALAERRKPLLESALGIAEGFREQSDLAQYLRRIAFLEAYLKDGQMRFRAIRRPVELSP